MINNNENIYYFCVENEKQEIYDIKELEKNDPVACFIRDNGEKINFDEIEEEKNTIIDDYINSTTFYRDKHYNSGVDYGDIYLSYTDTLEWANIENLENEIDNRIVIKKDTELYKKIYTEAKKYDY